MSWGQAGPSVKRPTDDYFERRPSTSLLLAEQLPLDSDSSRLKCEHRSGISYWFPLTASFIKPRKGKMNQSLVHADTDILVVFETG